MARSLAIKDVLFNLTYEYENTLTDSSIAKFNDKFSINDSLATGTEVDQADRLWFSKGRVLATGTSEDIDVYDLASVDIGAGSGSDALGQSFALTELVALVVHNKAASGNLKVGGKGTTAAFSSLFDSDDDAKIIVKAGGFAILYAPADPAYEVADTSNHVLKVQASGGEVTYDILIIGRSA
jgi:hypothetical protein